MEESTGAGPVQIVSITEDHKFVLNEKKLKEILYHVEWKKNTKMFIKSKKKDQRTWSLGIANNISLMI